MGCLSVPSWFLKFNFQSQYPWCQIFLDQTPLQLDCERIKDLREVGERGEVDYLRGVINQGTVIIIRGNTVNVMLQSRQVKCTPQNCINEFIIRKLNAWVVVDFRFISAFLRE